MCLSPVQVRRIDPVTRSTRIDVVPCGKCIECLRRKQSDYAFICSREARQSGGVFFLTLTYRNDSIPMAIVHETFDRTSGVVVDSLFAGFVKPEFESDARNRYYSVYEHSGFSIPVPVRYSPLLPSESYIKYGTFSGRPYYLERVNQDVRMYHSDDNLETNAFACPSLRRQDVKNWLKSSRQAYFRAYGYYPKFKYFEVGEYGPNTSRPHYHMMFYGCNEEVMRFFASRWHEMYGNYDLEVVTPRAGDSLDDAYQKVSRYLAKYLCKGEFEPQNVKDKYVERPRRVSSKRLGTDSLDDLRAYVLAFDVFGEYDPDRPPKDVLNNIPLLAERRYITTVDRSGRPVKVKIPKCIYEKCLSKTYGLSKEEKIRLGFRRSDETSFVLRVSHQRTLVHRKVSDYLKALNVQKHDHAIESIKRVLPEGASYASFSAAFREFADPDKITRSYSASAYRRELLYFYKQSKF